MAFSQLEATLPQLVLTDGFEIKVEAIDPTTGAAVTGVKVLAATMIARDITDTEEPADAAGPFMLVPGPNA